MYDDGLVCFCVVVVRVWHFRALVIGGLSQEGCLCVFLLCFLLSESGSLIVPLFVSDYGIYRERDRGESIRR